jgi:hypothetical protein
MTVTRINPPIPVWTMKGDGLAHFLIDYGPEWHPIWGVALHKGGRVWWLENPEIRFKVNETVGRSKDVFKDGDRDRSASDIVRADLVRWLGHRVGRTA